jgi:5-methylthioadenosine/S-adenosylhomocysteine deaminase
VGPLDALLARHRARKVIGGPGRIVLPGLVNTHTHAAMVLFRGLADDIPLKDWLEGHIWPAENRWLSAEFVSDAIALACLEMLNAGITTYNDMYFFGDETGRTTKKMGMRAVLGVGILDFPSVSASTQDEYFEKAERFLDAWQGDDLITPCIAPHALYTCGPETLARAASLAGKFGSLIHIHLSETEWEVQECLKRYGRRPVEQLAALGLLSPQLLAAHCVWLTDREVDLIAESGAGVSHCMESNLKLASGISPVPRMIAAGAKVTFGTDGAASNNDLSILSEMSTAAKVHKALGKDPTLLDSKTALLMATRWGAEALGLGEATGSLEEGKAADLIVIDTRSPHLTPLYNVYSHLVYSAAASDVESVMVNGDLVIENRRHTKADEGEILEKARRWAEKIRSPQ